MPKKYIPTQPEKPVHIYNPENWEPTKDLPPELHEHADAARYFVHRIFWGRVIDRSKPDGFVPLKAKYLQEVITDPDVYRDIKKSLIDRGVVATDNQYIIGSKCKGYRLTPRFSGRKHVRTEITDKFIAKRILAARKKDADTPRTEVHEYLNTWLHRLEIDHEAAQEHIAFNNSFFECHDGRHEATIDAIKDRLWHSVACPQGRIHTNVSSLETSLRQFLRIDGRKLVNLDIRNSQPLIFGSLILNSLKNDGFMESVHSFITESSSLCPKSQRQEFKKSLLSSLKPPSFSPSLPSSLYDLKNSPLNRETPEDAKKYIQLCEEGKFYDHLMDQANYSTEQRRQFKSNFFGETFFCKTRDEGQSSKPFKEEFPTVYRILSELKKRDHEAAALTLQRAESDIIINRVCRTLMGEYPNIPVVTIHDSIMTYPEHVDTVKGIMMDCFRSVGLTPTIRQED